MNSGQLQALQRSLRLQYLIFSVGVAMAAVAAIYALPVELGVASFGFYFVGQAVNRQILRAREAALLREYHYARERARKLAQKRAMDEALATLPVRAFGLDQLG